MKINLDFTLFEFKYIAPIVVLKKTLDKNRALSALISLSDADGEESLITRIDFTNLPSFHQYTLEEWEYILDQFFADCEISLDNILLSAPYFNMIKNPSVNYTGELLFIIESVLFAVIEKYSPSILSIMKNKEIKINGLYCGAIAPQSLPDSLPECLKIKIRPTKECLEETKKLIQHYFIAKPNIRLRLDGNRSFELNELLFFIKELKDFCGPNFFAATEYLEEPFKNQYDYLNFAKVYPIASALDESVMGLIDHLDKIAKLPASTHLVLKPSLIGISKSFEVMTIALQSGHNVVISSSYETNSALHPLLFLAANNPFTYHGLDTLKFLPKELGMNIANFCISI